MKYSQILTLYILSVLLFACKEEGPIIILEEVQKPLVDTSYIATTPIAAVPKNVLFEEFSGVRCSNCPVGNEITHNLVTDNPGRIAAVTVHSDFLAAPYDDYPDLRSEDADIIANTLGPVGSKPSCFINRKVYAGQRLVNSPNSWTAIVDDELSQTSEVGIQLEIIDFNIIERSFRYQVTMMYASEVANLSLGIYLTESEIISKQLNSTVKIDDYEHEYVLRKSITPIIGVPVTEAIEANTVIIKEFELNLNDIDPDFVWNMENMHLVAFLRQANDDIANAVMIDITD